MLGYFPAGPKNGNSFLSSSWFGLRPYSQISKASAYFTLAAFSSPYHAFNCARCLVAGAANSAAHSSRTAFFLAIVFRVRHERRRTVAAAFVELRFQRFHRRELLVRHVVDRHHDVRCERVWTEEPVFIKQEDGILREVGCVRAEEWDRHHVGRVHDQNA